MPEVLEWQVVATLGEFGDFDSFSGGDVTTTHTPYTPAGNRSPRKLPATYDYANITIGRVFVPERDRAVDAWAQAYKDGLESPRFLIVKYLNAQKVVQDTRTFPAVKPETVNTPSGASGSAALSQFTLTLAVDDRTM